MPAILGSGLVLAAHSAPGGAGLSSWGPVWGRGWAVLGFGREAGLGPVGHSAWLLGRRQPGTRLGGAGGVWIQEGL